MVCKIFKTVRITLALDGSEEEMFICHNTLLEDDQVMVEQDKGIKMLKLIIIITLRKKMKKRKRQ